MTDYFVARLYYEYDEYLIQFDTVGCDADIHVIVKIESADSIPNLHSIITASDGVLTYSSYCFFMLHA